MRGVSRRGYRGDDLPFGPVLLERGAFARFGLDRHFLDGIRFEESITLKCRSDPCYEICVLGRTCLIEQRTELVELLIVTKVIVQLLVPIVVVIIQVGVTCGSVSLKQLTG